MNRIVLFLAAVGICCTLVVSNASAQSLIDNEFYKKAKDLRVQSERAFQDGDYDRAATLAAQAKDLLAKSDAYVAKMTQFYRASGWLSRAAERIAYAKSIKADVNYKEAYNRALTAQRKAKEALKAEQYERSTGLSKDAVAALEKIGAVRAAKAAVSKPSTGLPKKYTVRLKPSRRDCLWRIAGYPFVFNDPHKWRVLYKANKSVLRDPSNPDLIFPGQVLTIPSLYGEKREGAYNPQRKYTPVKKHR